MRCTVAIHYIEHVLHFELHVLHFELLRESINYNVLCKWEVWPEGLIYVFSIHSALFLAAGNKTINRLKCKFMKVCRGFKL